MIIRDDNDPHGIVVPQQVVGPAGLGNVIDAAFLASRLTEATCRSAVEIRASELPAEIGDGRGLVRLAQAYAEMMPEATPDDAFRAMDALAWKTAGDLEQGWTPGAVKQVGTGWRFKAREIRLDGTQMEDLDG